MGVQEECCSKNGTWSNRGLADEDDDAPHAEDETVEAAETSCYEMHNHMMHSPTPSMK